METQQNIFFNGNTTKLFLNRKLSLKRGI